MANHAHDVVVLRAKVKTSVSSFSEARGFSLPLGKKLLIGYAPGCEDPKISVQGHDVFLRFQGTGDTHRDGFLANAREPFPNFTLAQQNEHTLFYDPGFGQCSEQLQQLFISQISSVKQHESSQK
jgi:hypothetical protein